MFIEQREVCLKRNPGRIPVGPDRDPGRLLASLRTPLFCGYTLFYLDFHLTPFLRQEFIAMVLQFNVKVFACVNFGWYTWRSILIMFVHGNIQFERNGNPLYLVYRGQ